QAMLFDQLILELEQQDLFIERYFYEEDPRLCWKKRYVEEVYLEDLFRKYPEDRVIVIGSVDHFFDPVDDHLCSWTHIFKKWKKVAIVTPKCPLDWGHREIALSHTHVLLPSTTLALSMLVDIFNQDQKISLRYWLEQNRYPIPPQDDSEELLAELEVYFDTSFDGFDRKYEKGSGKEIFTWLCMCSIYPEIFWDLTLTLGDALAKQKEMALVTPENLFKIVSLPWYRAGDMPDHLREKLMVRLSREDMILARKTLVEVLKDNPPPKDSYAEAEHQLQIALQEAAISPTISKNIKLIQEAQNYSINHEIKDFTVIKSLNSIPESMLKVSLPQKVSSAIFRQGIPALGAKTWVRGAIGTALVLMIIFTLDPSRLDRVHSFSGEKYFLENKSSRMRYHTYLGNVYLDSLNYTAARENYLKALSLRDEVREESYLVPEFNLTYLTWETGNQDEAKNEFARIGDKAEEIIADSSLNDNKKKVLATIRNEAKYNQGVINYRSQEIAEAEEQFRDVVKKDSSNTRAIYAEAVLFLQKALKTQGANRQNSFNLAMNRVKDIQSVSPDYFANHPELTTVLDSLNQSTQNPDIRTKISDLMLTIAGQEVVEVKEIPLTIDNNHTEEPTNIPSDLKYLTDFTEGLALVENKGKFGFIDEKANLKGVRFEDASPFSEGLAAVQSQGKWGFINKQLETVIPFEYERAKDFSNGWASVKIKGKWGMIDKENKMTIPPVYDAPVEFERTSSGDVSPLAAVFRNGKYEYINQEGELVFGDKKFQYAGNFNENNQANVKRWGKKYQIDRNGNCIESSVEDGKCPTEQWEYQQIATLKQHSEPINVALYAPDGTFLLTASSDGKAIIYDQRGSQVLTTLEHGSKINTAAISPNSNLIATGGEDQSVKVWRKASQNSWIQVHSFNDARATIWSLAFSPDSRLLAAGAGDQLIRIYDINTGASRRFSGHTIGAVTTLAFSPDGETLVSGGEDETVRFWNVSSGRQTTPISQPFGHVTSLAFSPDGKLLAIGTQNRLVKVYQTGSSPLKLIKQFDQFRDWVSSVSFSGDGQYLLASSYDNRLWIWNFTNRNPVLWLRHPGTVKSAAISPDGQYVLTASWGERGKNQARVFKIETYGK
ncbi:MAG: WG repeat-containing protein, partial [Bacteroidetes bacterium]|nr:WG repeat-containing protein [Bacteroidota bacterium]